VDRWQVAGGSGGDSGSGESAVGVESWQLAVDSWQWQ
jgi:hypothetical protein